MPLAAHSGLQSPRVATRGLVARIAPLLRLAFCCVALSALASPAAAGIVEYTNQASFDAATSGLSTETFEEYPAAYYGNSFNTINGVGLLTNGDVFIQNTNAYGTGNFFSAQQAPAGQPLVLSGNVPSASAVGAAYFAAGTGSVSVTTGGGTSVYNLPALTFPNAGFVGFTSSTPITGMSVTEPAGGGVDLDNLAVGGAKPGSTVSTTFHSIPSNYTLNDQTLLVTQTDPSGNTTYQVVAENGGGLGAPPPVFVDREPGSTLAVNVLTQYTNSTDGSQGVSMIVAESGGTAPPPPVFAPWDDTVVGGRRNRT